MMESIEFETSPTDETCVQVDSSVDYMPAMKAEAKRMLELLEKRFPDLEGYFKISRQSHDFGCYLEIQFKYDDTDDGIKEMQFVEGNYPATWNDTEVLKLYS